MTLAQRKLNAQEALLKDRARETFDSDMVPRTQSSEIQKVKDQIQAMVDAW